MATDPRRRKENDCPSQPSCLSIHIGFMCQPRTLPPYPRLANSVFNDVRLDLKRFAAVLSECCLAPSLHSNALPEQPHTEADNGKEVDGSLLGDANGVEPSPGGQKDGVKWQKPRLSRKALMKCCLIKWIIDSTASQGPGRGRCEEKGGGWRNADVSRRSVGAEVFIRGLLTLGIAFKKY
ncbi:CSEN protein, partial [Polyodon spathula]|nr:CSEN protein [Polyodon spathula]